MVAPRNRSSDNSRAEDDVDAVWLLSDAVLDSTVTLPCIISPESLLLLCIQRVFRLFEKLILQLQAGLVSFDGANGFDDRFNPAVHLPLAQFVGCSCALTRIMVRKTR